MQQPSRERKGAGVQTRTPTADRASAYACGSDADPHAMQQGPSLFLPDGVAHKKSEGTKTSRVNQTLIREDLAVAQWDVLGYRGPEGNAAKQLVADRDLRHHMPQRYHVIVLSQRNAPVLPIEHARAPRDSGMFANFNHATLVFVRAPRRNTCRNNSLWVFAWILYDDVQVGVNVPVRKVKRVARPRHLLTPRKRAQRPGQPWLLPRFRPSRRPAPRPQARPPRGSISPFQVGRVCSCAIRGNSGACAAPFPTRRTGRTAPKAVQAFQFRSGSDWLGPVRQPA